MILTWDCVEKMKELLPESIDLTVTSPPYDNLRTYWWNLEWNSKETIAGIHRITKRGGVVVWIVNDATVWWSETWTSFRHAFEFMEAWFLLHDTMIWEKPHFSNPSSTRYHQIFEYMFVFSKWKPKTFNPIRDVPVKYGKPVWKTSKRSADGSISNWEFSWKINEFSARRNLWKWNTVWQENFGKKVPHPAMFPIWLARDHIITWSNVGDTVLDPFAWSGTTWLAAKQLWRNFVLIEKNEEYAKIAEWRTS